MRERQEMVLEMALQFRREEERSVTAYIIIGLGGRAKDFHYISEVSLSFEPAASLLIQFQLRDSWEAEVCLTVCQQ